MIYRLKLTRPGRALSALAACACAIGVLASTTTEAHAGAYWSGLVAPLDRKASGSAYNLRSSWAYSDSISHKANTGAHYPGGTSLYANWAEGWGWACHPYAAGQTLGGMLRNPHSVTMDMYGYADFEQVAC